MTQYKKPLPLPYVDSKSYWDAARRHELRVQECNQCHERWFPPSPACPKCLCPDHEWILCSGNGHVYTFVIFHHVYGAEWAQDVPYNTAVVQLDEGPRLFTRLVNCSNEDIQIGLPVEAVFDDVTEEVTLPKFQPASAS